MHAQSISVDRPHEVPFQVLEEDDCHFPTHGLSVVGPIFLPGQGLIFCNVQDRRGLA